MLNDTHAATIASPTASQIMRLTMVPTMCPALLVLGCPSAASMTNSMKMVNSVMEEASFNSDSPSRMMRSRSGPPPAVCFLGFRL